MRAGVLGVWVLGVWVLAGCGQGASFDATCRQIFTTVCSHQLECDQITDHTVCDLEMQDRWICNPEVSVEDLEICKELAPTVGCNQAMPEECYEVLCDKELGCISTSIDTGGNPEHL